MTQKRFFVKKGDIVEVCVGKYKGKRGKVLKVFLKEEKVLVENVNVVKKHQKATDKQPGGIVNKTLPIHVSNVSLIDPSTDKTGKVGMKINEDGSKVRFFKKTQTELPHLSQKI